MSLWALFEAMRATAGDDERRQEELGALEAVNPIESCNVSLSEV